MKNNKVIILIFSLISLGLIFIQFRVYQSMIVQAFLINDFNNSEKRLNIEDLALYSINFPDITVTTIPMTTLVATYFLRDKKDSIALSLLDQSNKANPNLGIYSFEKGKYYSEKNNLEKAIEFAKQAVDKLPNNVNHLALYYDLLLKSEKFDVLIHDFETRKSDFTEIGYHENMWKIYFLSFLKKNKTLTDTEIKLFESKLKYFKNAEALSVLKPFIYIGEEKLNDAYYNAQMAESMFYNSRYEQAANYYLKAFEFNNKELDYIENAALCYFKLDQYLKSEELFKTILNYDTDRLKSHFYLSLILFDTGRNKEGCNYLQKCLDKKYPNSIAIARKYCLN